ncbi:MAG: TraX family protein [Eubacteriales bacterium]|nr:TraX family protein [Eubacteriales bacterium]
MRENGPVSLAAPNTDHGLIQVAAIVTMIIDHVGAVFFPRLTFLRVIGRIAFPLFCWGIAVGAARTRNFTRYALRLLALGIIAQPFYMLALNHTWNQLNVLATLLLGLLAIRGMQVRRYGSFVWAPAICLLVATAVTMDYGWQGVLLIILMYLARHTRGGLAALMVSFCLLWGTGSFAVFRGVSLNTGFLMLDQAINSHISRISLQFLAILALPLMMVRTDSGIRLPKWLSYAAYPGHLLILWLIKLLVRV